MALSNWLTRQEWNACFFLGAREIGEGRAPEPPPGQQHNLSSQMRAGIGVLHRTGYSFRGIDATADGDFEKREQCCEGNESVLADMVTGNFYPAARAREVIPWLREHVPSLDVTWMEEGLAAADKLADQKG